MTMLLSLLLAAAAPAAPTPEAERLGLALARAGALATLLPLIEQKETGELLAAHPELNASDRQSLRAAAAEVAAAGRERVMVAEGHAYAGALSLADLRALVAFSNGPAAARQRAALPGVIVGAIASTAGIDFKRDSLAAFCHKTGKLCS